MIRCGTYPSVVPKLLPFRIVAFLGLWIGGVAPAAADRLHPQDGPHAEVEFEAGPDALLVRIDMNLVFLDHLVETGRETPERIEAEELRLAGPALEAYFAERCAVTVDGTRLRPRIGRLARNDPDASLLPLFPRSGLRGLRKIRFDLTYPWPEAGRVPREIAVVWTCFPPDELSPYDPKPPLVIAAEFNAEGRRVPIEFTAAEPEFRFHASGGGALDALDLVPRPATISAAGGRREAARRLVGLAGLAAVAFGAGIVAIARTGVARAASLAVAAAAALGAGHFARSAPAGDLPGPEDAAGIFLPLHRNLYRAFEFTDEGAIYDALAASVDGRLLEDLYLSIRRGLVMQEEGGAVSRVRALRPLELAVEEIGLAPDGAGGEAPAFTVRCRFAVDGRVTHWGHSHDRTIEYLVRYAVAERDGRWKFADAEVLEQRRTDDGALPPESPLVDPDGSFEV